MKKTNTLKFNADTIRVLSAPDLARVVGGAASTGSMITACGSAICSGNVNCESQPTKYCWPPP